jgi:hypothetical protein
MVIERVSYEVVEVIERDGQASALMIQKIVDVDQNLGNIYNLCSYFDENFLKLVTGYHLNS